MTNGEKLQALRDAFQKMRRTRFAVTDWMRQEAERGRLRRNDDSPHWQAYMAASAAFDALAHKLLGSADPEESERAP